MHKKYVIASITAILFSNVSVFGQYVQISLSKGRENNIYRIVRGRSTGSRKVKIVVDSNMEDAPIKKLFCQRGISWVNAASIDVSDTGITLDTLKKIGNTVGKKVKELNLKRCTKITKKEWETFQWRKAFPNLQKLDVSETNIPEVSLRRGGFFCPRSKVEVEAFDCKDVSQRAAFWLWAKHGTKIWRQSKHAKTKRKKNKLKDPIIGRNLPRRPQKGWSPWGY